MSFVVYVCGVIWRRPGYTDLIGGDRYLRADVGIVHIHEKRWPVDAYNNRFVSEGWNTIDLKRS